MTKPKASLDLGHWQAAVVESARLIGEKSHAYSCAYCPGRNIKAIRIDCDEESPLVTLVNWCPDCGKEDWIRIYPGALAMAALIADEALCLL